MSRQQRWVKAGWISTGIVASITSLVAGITVLDSSRVVSYYMQQQETPSAELTEYVRKRGDVGSTLLGLGGAGILLSLSYIGKKEE